MSKAVDVILKVNGFKISGFDDVEVSLNLYSLVNLARLNFSDKNSDDLLTAKDIIRSEAEAVVYFENKPVVSGYVYAPSPEFSSNGAALNVVVVSPIAKYIGQSIQKGKTYYNQGAAAVLADICPDIKIEVRSNKILPKFVTYGFETTESIIQKFCNKTDTVIYSGPLGQLIVDDRSSASAAAGTIATGKNVLSVGRVESNDNAVVIVGQLPFDDNVSLDAAVCSRINASGSGKTRFYYGDDISPAAVKALKFWTKRVPVTIPNWFDNAGNLLELNNWYKAVDAWHGLNEAMRLYALNFRLSKKDGYSADLQLEV